jgi:hypothetical protein
MGTVEASGGGGVGILAALGGRKGCFGLLDSIASLKTDFGRSSLGPALGIDIFFSSPSFHVNFARSISFMRFSLSNFCFELEGAAILMARGMAPNAICSEGASPFNTFPIIGALDI